MHPKISVVMPVYNAAAHLAEAVRSVLAQSFADFELLIINDGSTDNSAQILKRFSDPRLRILDQKNCGVVAALNRGIREARGSLICRMDSDDICIPDRLARQAEYLDAHSDIALVGGFITTIDEDGHELAPVVPYPLTHEEIWAGLGVRPWVMCHPAVMFRRQAALDAGLYDPAFLHAEDAEFFARLMSRHRAANLPRVVLRYRLRRGGVSMKNKRHGQINAALVAEMIRQWRPGEPFTATAEQRRAADCAIEAADRPASQGEAEAAYRCRIARELLRGRQWTKAAGHYFAAARHQPFSWLAYAGIACALLRVGGAAGPGMDGAAA
jgi:glycosyltransferase involved in cell wall biosynthesis